MKMGNRYSTNTTSEIDSYVYMYELEKNGTSFTSDNFNELAAQDGDIGLKCILFYDDKLL